MCDIAFTLQLEQALVDDLRRMRLCEIDLTSVTEDYR